MLDASSKIIDEGYEKIVEMTKRFNNKEGIIKKYLKSALQEPNTGKDLITRIAEKISKSRGDTINIVKKMFYDITEGG